MPKSHDRRRQPSASKMANPAPFLVVGLVIGVPLAVYILFLGLSAIPFFQRQ